MLEEFCPFTCTMRIFSLDISVFLARVPIAFVHLGFKLMPSGMTECCQSDFLLLFPAMADLLDLYGG